MKINDWNAADIPVSESNYHAPFFVESTGISNLPKGHTGYLSGYISQAGFNWIISGTLEKTVGTKRVIAGPGHFFYNVSGEEIWFHSLSDDCSMRWVALSGPLADAILQSYHYPRLQISDHPYPAELFARLDSMMSSSSPLQNRLKAALVMEILAYAAGAGYGLEENRKIIDRGLAIIKRNLDNPELCVEYLCKHLGVSQTTLTRIFRKEMRISPGRHILNLRLKLALSLLSGTDTCIRLVAEQCGFRDPKTFSRFMKRATGFGPLAYRKAKREKMPSEP